MDAHKIGVRIIEHLEHIPTKSQQLGGSHSVGPISFQPLLVLHNADFVDGKEIVLTK
jgi:hypothetical protein